MAETTLSSESTQPGATYAEALLDASTHYGIDNGGWGFYLDRRLIAFQDSAGSGSGPAGSPTIGGSPLITFRSGGD